MSLEHDISGNVWSKKIFVFYHSFKIASSVVKPLVENLLEKRNLEMTHFGFQLVLTLPMIKIRISNFFEV